MNGKDDCWIDSIETVLTRYIIFVLFARALPPSLLVQAVVHCGPLFTVIWWSHSPARRQCRPVLFCCLANNLKWPSDWSKAPPPQTVPVLNSTTFWKLCFPLGLRRERLWVGILKGNNIHFDWLIDWRTSFLGSAAQCDLLYSRRLAQRWRKTVVSQSLCYVTLKSANCAS